MTRAIFSLLIFCLWLGGAKGACLSNAARFEQAIGQDLETNEYYDRAPYPEMLNVPQQLTQPAFLELLQTDSAHAIAQARRRIEEINLGIADEDMRWRAFEYESTNLASLDGKMGRFFVYVPGKDFDRYIQFAMPKARALSIVTVQKTDPVTRQSLAVPKAMAIDLWRTSNPAKPIGRALNFHLKSQSCYSCHTDAVLPIRPKEDSFNAALYAQTVAYVNRQMRGYRRLRLAEIDYSAWGPAMGPIDSPFRNEQLFSECAPSLMEKPQSLSRVKEAMSCAKCHDGEQRAELTAGSDGISLRTNYIRLGLMPPGAKLTKDEREALLSCLQNELKLSLEDWKQGETCD